MLNKKTITITSKIIHINQKQNTTANSNLLL